MFARCDVVFIGLEVGWFVFWISFTVVICGFGGGVVSNFSLRLWVCCLFLVCFILVCCFGVGCCWLLLLLVWWWVKWCFVGLWIDCGCVCLCGSGWVTHGLCSFACGFA